MPPGPTQRTALKDLRHARGVSRAELAAAAGLAPTYLRNLEQGVDPLRVPTAIAIAGALHEISRLTTEEQAALERLGVPRAALEEMSARRPRGLAGIAPAALDRVAALHDLLGPERFLLWLESSLAGAAASAPPPAPPPPVPRLTTEEVDPVTGARWKVRIADPAHLPTPQAPAQERAKDTGGEQTSPERKGTGRKKA